MTTLGERLKRRRLTLGMKQDEIAKRLGTSQSKIAQLEKGFIKSSSMIPVIADILGVEAIWLSEGRGPEIKGGGGNDQSLLAYPRKIPVTGTVLLSDDGLSEIRKPDADARDGYIEYPLRDKAAYAIRCRCDHSGARIRDGEFVIVEPGIAPKPGDCVLVQAVDDRVMIATYLYQRHDKSYLMPLDETRPPIVIPCCEIEGMEPITAIIVNQSLWSVD